MDQNNQILISLFVISQTIKWKQNTRGVVVKTQGIPYWLPRYPKNK